MPHLMRTTSLSALAAALMMTGAAAQDESSGLIEDILITARKKAETLQTAPISVGALTAESINQLAVRDVADIAKTISGISFENDFGRQGDRPTIRGQASILGESGVAFFVDGVYTSNSISNINVQEVDRIEVVKGPQSALYGRNTYSGAINVITRKPGEEFSGRLLAEAAEFGDLQFTGYVSGPITDNLGFIVSARYYERDGTFTNQFDGDDLGDEQSTNFSGGLFFDPSESARFELRVAYGEDRDGPIPSFLQRADDNNCFTDTGALYNGNGRYFCGTIDAEPSNLDYSRQFATRPGFSRDRLNASLKSEFDFDFATFTHIVGFNENDETFRSDSDHGPFSFEPVFFAGFPSPPPFAPPFRIGVAYGGIADFSFEQESEQQEFSNEIRLASKGDGPLQWLVGGFYLDIDQANQGIRNVPTTAQAQADSNFLVGVNDIIGKTISRGPFPGFYDPSIPLNFNPEDSSPEELSFNLDNPSQLIVARNRDEEDIRNIALFGQISYDFTDRFSASVELRYAEDRIRARRIIQNLGQEPTDTVDFSQTFKSFTPRFTANFQATPDNLFYANIAKGVKPGGINGATAIQLSQGDVAGADGPSAAFFDEEEVWAFELGTKNTFLEGQLRFNAAAFFNTVSGYQLTQTVAAGNGTTSATTNAGNADIYGIEVETIFAPAALEGVTFTFNGTWVDSTFTSGFDENQGVLNDVLDDMSVNCSTGDQFPNDFDDDNENGIFDEGEEICTSLFGDITGKRIPRQARWQLFGDVTYRGNITDDIGFFIGANVSYQSSQFVQVHNEASFGEFTLVNLNAGIQGDFWEVQIFGRNITNEDSPVSVTRYVDGQEDFRRAFFGVQRPGSQWGGRVIFKY
ncbi:MAG: TonB-dependent receptor [Pseudomonadota bacterium]